MIWGTDGGKLNPERLDPLGLTCYGGGSNKNGDMTYHVYGKNIDLHLTMKEYNNIEEHLMKSFPKESMMIPVLRKKMRKNKVKRILL